MAEPPVDATNTRLTSHPPVPVTNGRRTPTPVSREAASGPFYRTVSQQTDGSSLLSALLAGTVAVIIVVLAVQSVALVILWIQINALADHAATLAASDLSEGTVRATHVADSSIYASGIFHPDEGAIRWHISGQVVQLTLSRTSTIITGTTSITAMATAIVN